MVQNIENFRAELEVLVFPERIILDHRKVSLIEWRARHRIASQVPLCSFGSQRERCRIEPALSAALATRQVWVSDQHRTVDIAASDTAIVCRNRNRERPPGFIRVDAG